MVRTGRNEASEMTAHRQHDRLKAPAAASRLSLVETEGFADYRLLDSGSGRKLERFGRVTVDRPEPQALWQRRLPAETWDKADAVFAGSDEEENGRWRTQGRVPESWPVKLKDVTLTCRLSAFRHLGLFPEQLPHWEWMERVLAGAKGGEGKPRVLNLFAYTGAASLIAARAGAEVTHVDASRKAITWARENQAASRMEQAPIRWMLEDARKFVAREVRRKRTYTVILVDPPKFGRGPNNETWDIFEHLPEMMRACAELLDGGRSALVLTAYAIRASSLMLDQLTREVLAGRGGHFESGELAIREHEGTRAVPTSLFTRWCGDDIAL